MEFTTIILIAAGAIALAAYVLCSTITSILMDTLQQYRVNKAEAEEEWIFRQWVEEQIELNRMYEDFIANPQDWE